MQGDDLQAVKAVIAIIAEQVTASADYLVTLRAKQWCDGPYSTTGHKFTPIATAHNRDNHTIHMVCSRCAKVFELVLKNESPDPNQLPIQFEGKPS